MIPRVNSIKYWEFPIIYTKKKALWIMPTSLIIMCFSIKLFDKVTYKMKDIIHHRNVRIDIK